MPTHHLSLRPRVLAALCFVCIVAAFPTVSARTVGPRITRHAPVLKDTRNATCLSTGRCKTGEKRVIATGLSSSTLRTLQRKGCKLNRQWHTGTSLQCPETVSVPSERTERLFGVDGEIADARIGATAVQATSVNGQGIPVAVLDTGIDTTHPELQGKIAMTAVFTGTGSIADAIGHGTHVAGIIAGQGTQTVQNTNGVADRALGVAPGANLYIGKVCGDDGWCPEGDIVAGIEWAVAQHARVINLSLGGGAFVGNCDTDPLAAEVNWAADQGVTVVVAAGNGGTNGEGIATPACASKAIAVGALDGSNVRTPWSQEGTALDLMAPGIDILSSVSCLSAGTCPDAAYGWWSGTSMAAPQVTGAAALVLQKHPSLTPLGVRNLLETTATDLGATGFDSSYGFGEVNVQAAADALDAYDRGKSSQSSSSLSSSSVSTSSSSQSSVNSSSSSQTSSASSVSSSSAVSSIGGSSDSSVASSARSFDREYRGGDNHPGQGVPCKLEDWLCRDAGECLPEGFQKRLCTLLNAKCTHPENAAPPVTHPCLPPRPPRWQQGNFTPPQSSSENDDRRERGRR